MMPREENCAQVETDEICSLFPSSSCAGSQRHTDSLKTSWIHGKKSTSSEIAFPPHIKSHMENQDRNFGSWEQHTKGIGHKLLNKMGYKPGEGLGKNGQGIIKPVEAVLRKGRGAIGAHRKERTEQSIMDYPIKDEEELSQWRMQPVAVKKQKPKFVYETAQEVLETGGKRRKPVVDTGLKVKVIDMTGREPRVLPGYCAIFKRHDQPDEVEKLLTHEPDKTPVFNVPQLMHKLLVEMAEDEITHNNHELRQNHRLNRLQTFMDLVRRMWRNTDHMIKLLKTWKPKLPPWVLEKILVQLVPFLLQEVENWDPQTDTTPTHCWLHPWIPLMGDKLEPLYAPIQQKIANALTNWHPSDVSAKIMLQSWQGVFRPGHMSAFLVKNILPKLELEIQKPNLNPLQQYEDPWRWVMSWKDLMPVQAMVDMLEKAFFPKWHQQLAHLLTNLANYQDISGWYLGWKAQFPENLIGHPLIIEQFNKALETINRAVSDACVPDIKENFTYLALTENRLNLDSRTPAKQQTSASDNKPVTSRLGGSVPSRSRVTDNVPSRSRLTDNVPSRSRLTDNFPSSSRLTDIVPSSSKFTYIVPSTPRLASSVPSTSRLTDNVPSTSRLTDNVPSTSRLTNNVPSTSRLTDNVPSTSKFTYIVPSTSRPTNIVSLTSRLTDNVPSTSRLTDNVPSTSRLASNVPSTFRLTDNVPSTLRLADNVPSTFRLTDNVPSTFRLTDNVPSTSKFTYIVPSTSGPTNIASLTSRLTDNVPSTSRLTDNVPSTSRLASNVPSSFRLTDNVPSTLRLADNVSSTFRLADNVSSTLRLADNVSSTFRLADNVSSTSRLADNVPSTFKELVERKAEHGGLLYIPIPGKRCEGRQIYRFGQVSIYYDRNVVFMQDRSSRQWLPTSLNRLTEAAKLSS